MMDMSLLVNIYVLRIRIYWLESIPFLYERIAEVNILSVL